MTTLVRFIPRKGAGVDATLDRQIDAEEIWFGRGTGNTVPLVDRRVQFRHASFTYDGTGFAVRAAKGATVVSGGREVDAARLQMAGDTVGVGSFTVTLTVPGAEPVLTVEGGISEEVNETDLMKSYMSVFSFELPLLRKYSWLLSFIIFVAMFAIPLAFAPGGPGKGASATTPPAFGTVQPINMWLVGRVSSGHSAFVADCKTCHVTPFIPVQASACLSCHATVGQHADPHAFPHMNLANESCETCHHEHKGSTMAIRSDEFSCASCHSNIKAEASNATVMDVTDFGSGHPDFAPTVITNSLTGETKRVRLGSGPIISETNLRFPHGKHLVAGGVKGPNGNVVMNCQSCHEVEPGGRYMAPVKMEKACISCHELNFEPKHPEWRLAHGQPKDLPSRVTGFYAQAILNGETFGPELDKLFAKPGSPPPAPGPSSPIAMARAQAAAALGSSIARSTCGTCHVIDAPAAGKDELDWTVRPVVQPTSFLKLARFSHAKHETMSCDDCHAAIRKSGLDERGKTPEARPVSLDEVVIPDIASCRACHTGEKPKVDRVATTCIACHGFHENETPIQPPPRQHPGAIEQKAAMLVDQHAERD